MAIEKTYAAIDLEPSRLDLSEGSPLHITVTPPAQMEEDQASRFGLYLRAGLYDVDSFSITATDEDQFGPHEAPVRVRRFTRNAGIELVHARAINVLGAVVGNEVDMTYAGDKYQPHATYKGERGVEQGTELIVDHLIVLRKREGVWQRMGMVPLKKSIG